MKNETNKPKKLLFLSFIASINIFLLSTYSTIYSTIAQTNILPVEGSATWTSIGPGGGGAMISIAVDPTDENIVYIGTDLGGIFKSTDGGQSFRAINNGLKNFVIQEIVIDPVSPNIIYIGTEGGIYKSTDAGESWTIKRNGFPPISSSSLSAPIKGLSIDPNNTNVIYAGIGRSRGNRYFRDNYENFGCGQIYKSTNSGETWFKVNKPGPNNIDPFATIFEISVNPKNSNMIFATTNKGFYKSLDGGINWKKKTKGLPFGSNSIYIDDIRGLAIADEPQKSNIIIYITVISPSGELPWRGGVYKSLDEGETWLPKTDGLTKNIRPGSLWETSNYPDIAAKNNILYTGDWSWGASGIHKSTNGGESWKRTIVYNNSGYVNIDIYPYGGANVSSLALAYSNPDVVYFGSGMGLYKTINGGQSWIRLHNVKLDSGSLQTTGIENTYLLDIDIDYSNPDVIYFFYADIGPYKTKDGGNTFESSYQVFEHRNDTQFIIDPDDSNIIYASGYMYKDSINSRSCFIKSSDSGKSWRIIADQATGFPNSGISSIVIDPDSPIQSRTIYISASNATGVYKSIDGGIKWIQINKGFEGSLNVKKLFMVNSNTIYACVRAKGSNGFNDYGGIYKTIDGGKNWVRIDDKKLPDAWDLVVYSSVIYVGTRRYWDSANSKAYQGGLYISSDDGRNWKRVLDDLWINSIAINPKNPNIIYAGGGDSPYHDEWLTKLYKSVDAGKNWKTIKDGLPSVVVIAITPSNPDIIYVGTGGSGVLKVFDPLVVEVNRYLDKGWNLISIPVQVTDEKIDQILKSINGDYESVWTFDNNWKQYNANMPDWVNDLYTIEPGKGYWINMFRNSILKIIGKPIDNPVIHLNKGWNLVGYNRLVSMPIEIALSSINNNYDSVWAYDREYEAYSKNKPYNSLKIMRPGDGYWINVLNNCEWYIIESVLSPIE